MCQCEKYDIVIIGSGLGGLLCANILAMRGKKVCVLEKNKQFGGNLQTFARDKQVFDTGVHYIGGLDKGQNLYQVFKYVGLMEQLKLEKMEVCFDKVLMENDTNIYCLAQGYEAFVKNLAQFFPEEKSNILAYCRRIKEVCTSFPLYNLTLKSGDTGIYNSTNENAKEVIGSFTNNKKLQAILAGNNLLYAGDAGKTPFHVHALITNSYIESSWKCVNGGSQIAKILVANIRKNSGGVVRNCEVKSIVEENGRIAYVETEREGKVYGDYFISNINPASTLHITVSSLLKGLYRKRIESLPQGISSFSVHIVLKAKTIPYEKCNYYYHQEGQLWNLNNYTKENWPLGYGLYFTEDKRNKGFAATVSLLTPMRFEEVAKWSDTYNRVGKSAERGAGYEQFKTDKTSKLLQLVRERFPELVKNIKSVYASTPLTNRDYIGDATGSMYGIEKDHHDPLKTMISPRTKIPNLFLTGQNLNLHGILGTSLSAVLTCVMLLDDEGLVEDIRKT
ncbi:phytoene desaturase family protein [Niabella aquatica]